MKDSITQFFRRHPLLSTGITILIFVFVQAIFSFCSKKTCPAFESKPFNNWFPYAKGQTLLFISNKGNQDTLKIVTRYSSAAYMYGGIYSRPRECRPDGRIVSQPLDNGLPFLLISAENVETLEVDLTIKQFRLLAVDLSDSGLVLTPESGLNHTSAFLDRYVFEGRTYNNVQTITRDTSSVKNSGIYKIWLSKSNGIIGYEDYPTLERWARQ